MPKENAKHSIALTKEQYRELLLDVMIGTYIRGGVAEMQGKNFREVEKLKDYLLSFAKEFDAEDLIEHFKGAILSCEELCNESDEIIEEYNNDEFWNRLEIDLGKRDFLRCVTDAEKEEMERTGWLSERVHEFYEHYGRELEDHGIENLEIVRRMDMDSDTE